MQGGAHDACASTEILQTRSATLEAVQGHSCALQISGVGPSIYGRFADISIDQYRMKSNSSHNHPTCADPQDPEPKSSPCHVLLVLHVLYIPVPWCMSSTWKRFVVLRPAPGTFQSIDTNDHRGSASVSARYKLGLDVPLQANKHMIITSTCTWVYAYIYAHACINIYYFILSYPILYYIILHYIVLYYTILYYIILYYTILYYIILYYIYIILYYTILYYILYYNMLYIILYIVLYIILYDMIWYDIILYYIIHDTPWIYDHCQ